jgi:predicted transposase YbfD/YdcC
VRVESTRRIGEGVTTEARHYLSSLPADAALLARAIRGHWGVENRLHWVLDVAFREDDSRVRVGHAPENLAILRHVALNLLRRQPPRRTGVAPTSASAPPSTTTISAQSSTAWAVERSCNCPGVGIREEFPLARFAVHVTGSLGRVP